MRYVSLSPIVILLAASLLVGCGTTGYVAGGPTGSRSSGAASGQVSTDCGSCKGSGKGRQACTGCDGSGIAERVMVHGQPGAYGCTSCGGARGNLDGTGYAGRGWIEGVCDSCSGSGRGSSSSPSASRPRAATDPNAAERARLAEREKTLEMKRDQGLISREEFIAELRKINQAYDRLPPR